MQFQCPPVPCVCPPCPICPTYTERAIELAKTGVKLFVFYALVKWTVNQNLWAGHNGTARFTLEFLESNFPPKSGIASVSVNIIYYFKFLISSLSVWHFTQLPQSSSIYRSLNHYHHISLFPPFLTRSIVRYTSLLPQLCSRWYSWTVDLFKKGKSCSFQKKDEPVRPKNKGSDNLFLRFFLLGLHLEVTPEITGLT